MSIIHQGVESGTYILVCDLCGIRARLVDLSPQGVVNWALRRDWGISTEVGTAKAICPKCVEEFDL